MIIKKISTILGFPSDSVVKNLPAYIGDVGLIPGSEKKTGAGNGDPLQYSCQENPMDRGIWWATVMVSQRVRHDWVTEHVDMYSITSQNYNHQGIFVGKNNYEMFV